MKLGHTEVISLMGPPGSGKGTVTQAWHNSSEVKVLSTGALCRFHVREQTSFGKEFSDRLARGELIPDSLISNMVQDWLEKEHEQACTILLDGYPRTEQQVALWATMMSSLFAMCHARVILFELADDIIVNRLSDRLVCSNASCQHVYSKSKLPIDFEGTCLACHTGLLMRRADDKPEVIRKRLALYAEHKADMLKAYQSLEIPVDIFNVTDIPLNQMVDSFSALLQCGK